MQFISDREHQINPIKMQLENTIFIKVKRCKTQIELSSPDLSAINSCRLSLGCVPRPTNIYLISSTNIYPQ